jgi:hypothetical protein
MPSKANGYVDRWQFIDTSSPFLTGRTAQEGRAVGIRIAREITRFRRNETSIDQSHTVRRTIVVHLHPTGRLNHVRLSSEKAELFDSVHSYEAKLEEEQSRQWVHDEDVLNCSKCQAAFGWTLRRVSVRSVSIPLVHHLFFSIAVANAKIFSATTVRIIGNLTVHLPTAPVSAMCNIGYVTSATKSTSKIH